MMAAVAGRPSTHQSETQCPTAECSFKKFTTLGACLACEPEIIKTNLDFGCEYYIRDEVSGSAPYSVL